MAGASAIEWTDATWNPIVGCPVVSPGCTHCYAMGMAHRIVAMAAASEGGQGAHYAGTTRKVNGHAVWTGKVALAPEATFRAPLSWKKPRRIFVNSMGDLFHEAIPDAWIDRVFAVMALCPQHTFQVLTKRAERMRQYLSAAGRYGAIDWWNAETCPGDMYDAAVHERWVRFSDEHPWPLPNVWLGVSAERQQEADERIPHLLASPAAVRFVSAEPLLGPIDLTDLSERGDDTERDALRGTYFVPGCGSISSKTFRGAHLDWVIAGGESGPNARPMHPDWARALRDQCAAAGVPFFFKQWGEWLPWNQFGGTDIDDDAEQTRYHTMEWCRDRWSGVGRPQWHDSLDGNIDDLQCVGRVGKKRAGRLLDGQQHNAFPGGAA